MNLRELLTALDALLANKLRAVLTMLGVIIGVAAVIALVSIGNGLDAFITGEIQSIGSNLLFVTTDSENSGGYPALSLDDVEALSDPFNAPALAAVSAEIGGQQEVIAMASTNALPLMASRTTISMSTTTSLNWATAFAKRPGHAPASPSSARKSPRPCSATPFHRSRSKLAVSPMK